MHRAAGLLSVGLHHQIPVLPDPGPRIAEPDRLRIGLGQLRQRLSHATGDHPAFGLLHLVLRDHRVHLRRRLPHRRDQGLLQALRQGVTVLRVQSLQLPQPAAWLSQQGFAVSRREPLGSDQDFVDLRAHLPQPPHQLEPLAVIAHEADAHHPPHPQGT